MSGLSDSVGNTWNVLDGPTTWAGSTFTLLSAIYYVNAPVTSATHTLTVQLDESRATSASCLRRVGVGRHRAPNLLGTSPDPGAGGASVERDDGADIRTDQQLVAGLGQE